MTSILSQLSLAAVPTVLAVLVFLAKATLLLLLTLVGAAALRWASAGARHIVWVGALAALVLLPVLSHWMPWRLAVVPSSVGTMLAVPRGVSGKEVSRQATRGCSDLGCIEQEGRSLPPGQMGAGAAAAGESQPHDVMPPQDILPQPQSTLAATQRGASQQSKESTVSLWRALAIVWAIGTLVLLGRLLAGMAAVRRIVRDAQPLENTDWTVPLWEVADRLDLGHAPRLLRGDGVSMPFACGLVHPTIVLPHDADGWSDARRRAVLFHELAHVRRRDLVGHTLGRIACALYWFHPLVWTAARRLRAESERACDDLVLASGTRASEYADHLLQIVTGVRNASAPAVALAMARRKEFEGRMLAILDPALRRAAPSRLQAVALVLGLAGLAVSVSAMVPATEPRVAASVVEPAETVHDSVRVAATGTAAIPKPVVPAPSPKSAVDTGEHDHLGSIGQVVSSVVNETVEPVVNETVVPVVNETLDQLFGDGHGRALGMDAHSLDGMRRTIRNSVKASFGERPSSTHADSGTTALLVQLLQSDSDAKVRRTAAWALAQRDERNADAPLAAALEHDKSADVREMAAWGLGQTEGTAAVQALGDAVQRDADERVKSTAAWALGQIGDAAAVPALDAALSDPSARVRSRAAWALGQIEPRSAPRGLVTALGDSSSKVRLTAAWALGQIEDPKTLSALSAALATEQDHDTRRAELRAMLKLGETSDAALRELLKSPDPDIRLRATRALAGYGTGAWPWPWPWPMPRPMP